MAALNLIVLLFLTGIYGWLFLKRIHRYGLTFSLGITLGVLFFLIVPFWIAALTGELTIDQEAMLGTDIPNLNWDDGAETISLMLLPLITLIPYILIAPSLKKNNNLILLSHGETVSWRWWFAIYIAFELFLFVASGLMGGGHWYKTKGDFLLEYGQSAILLVFITTAVRLILIAIITAEYMADRLSTFGMSSLFGIMSLLVLYTTGNRVWVLFIVASLLAIAIIKKKYSYAFFGIFFAIPLGLVMSIFKWIRPFIHNYSGFSFAGMSAAMNTGIDFAMRQMVVEGFGVREFFQGITESVDVNVYYGIVKYYGSSTPFLWGGTIFKIFTFWIPRSIWAEKPETITVSAAQFFAPNVPTLSLIPTIFGEFYANFGLLFLIILPIILLIIDRALLRFFKDTIKNGINMAILFISGFALVRFPLSDFILYVLIAGFALWLNRRFSKSFLRKSHRP